MAMQSSAGEGVRRRGQAVARLGITGDAVPYFLAMMDALIICLASVFGGVAYHLTIGSPLPDLFPYCAVGLLASFIYILRIGGAGYYELSESVKPRVEIADVTLCWVTTALLLAFFAFLFKVGVSYSRGAFVAFFFVTPVGLLGIRKTSKVLLGSVISLRSLSRSDIVLIGAPQEIAKLERQDMLTFFGAADVDRFVFEDVTAEAVWGDADERLMQRVVQYVRANNCREIFLALPWTHTERIDLILDRIKILPIAARLLPDHCVRSLSNYAPSARQRVLAIEVQRAPLSSAERLAKRGLDLIVGTLAVVSLWPIFLLTAIAIKLDGPGPIIFRQRRKGFNGREFTMLKFRTMNVQENGAVVFQATRNDPRVTPIGRLLRSTSIDELPQIINVLKGDMSLIGPRPHALAHDDYFQDLLSDYAFRHHVKPGLTGWAQCNGSRGATPSVEHVAERVKLDLWYINNWSLWLDLTIIMKTFFEVLRKRNAY